MYRDAVRVLADDVPGDGAGPVTARARGAPASASRSGERFADRAALVGAHLP